MLKNILNEIYLESNLLYVEDERLFNYFKKFLKRSWVFFQVLFFLPVIWLFKKLEKKYE